MTKMVVPLLVCSSDLFFISRIAAAKVQICCSGGDWRAKGRRSQVS